MLRTLGSIYLVVAFMTAVLSVKDFNDCYGTRGSSLLPDTEVTVAVKGIFWISGIAWPYYLPKMITSYNKKKQFCIK